MSVYSRNCERRSFTATVLVISLVMGSPLDAVSAVTAPKRDGVLRRDDVVYPKLALTFSPGESVKVVERSSFSIETGSPLQDRCEIRLNDQETNQIRAIGRLKVIENVRFENLQPRFEIEKFMTDFRKAAPKIFSTMIKQDSAEGIVFRREDLREEMTQILAMDPMRQVPKGYRERLEQSLVTHLWGCYGDLLKFKSAASHSLQRRMSEFKSLWTRKLASDVETGLRRQTRGQRVGSDQMTKTRLRMDLKQGVPGVADPRVQIDCVFEGPASTFNVERLNAVLSPYMEVFPRQVYRRMIEQNSLPLRQQANGKATFY